METFGGFGLVILGLTLLATVGGWAYSGPEAVICAIPSGCGGSAPVLHDELAVLRPAAFAATALASVTPLFGLIDRRLWLRLVGAGAAAAVAGSVLAHALYPPAWLLDQSTGTSLPYTGPTALEVVGLAAVAAGSAIELWGLFPRLGWRRAHPAPVRPGRGPHPPASGATADTFRRPASSRRT